jgi:hypothetical protein
LVFRILYFLIPFGISISIMGTREFWLNVARPWQERRRLNDALADSNAVPLKGRQSLQPVTSRQPPQANSRRSQG